jgi:hypothetical protein
VIYTGDYTDLLTLLQGSAPPTETIYLQGLVLVGDQQTAVEALGWTITTTYQGAGTVISMGSGASVINYTQQVQQLTPPGQPVSTVVTAAGQPVPNQVTMRQARLALLQANLLDQTNAAVQSAGAAAQITWEYASSIERNDPLLLQLQSVLGLTSDQMDQLFITASTL